MLAPSVFIRGSRGRTDLGRSSDVACVGVQCRGGICRGAPAETKDDVLLLGVHRHSLFLDPSSMTALHRSAGRGGCWSVFLYWSLHPASSSSAAGGSPPPADGRSAFHHPHSPASDAPPTMDLLPLLPRRWPPEPRRSGAVDYS
ncbi:hypothetical protein GDO81_028741 [Engystomops pustulosus]|uniref:Uncharacterized protein n=1 Tax=Engystomops pustulosus TaxID=76066 RepID=A0AAV6YCW7_ENGPU|nr:hypothetical protein GDO81_028741 [Engystomops pustulosus]